jgi:GntR family transcriptional repressor for pyruvate dehydrogenase complex
MSNTKMSAKPITLTEQVSQEVIHEIQRGDYPVGSKLPSGKDLAARFGVSAAVIREVTERLREKGLIESRQGVGCWVKARIEASGFRIPHAVDAELANIFELRMDLEGASAALAAVRRTDDDLAALSGILRSLEDNLYHPAQGPELDIGFHVAIAQATHNSYFVDLLRYLHSHIRQSIGTARANSALHEHVPEQVHREHVRVYDAIRESDPPAARLAMATHLQSAAARLNLTMASRHI